VLKPIRYPVLLVLVALSCGLLAATPERSQRAAPDVGGMASESGSSSLYAHFKEMGLTAGAQMRNSPQPAFYCGDKLRRGVALESSRPSTVVWTRCVPADCSDATRLDPVCWRMGSDGGTKELGYARDHVEIAGSTRAEFAGSGDEDGPQLLSVESVPLADGREGLLISSKYSGTNHTLLQCLLALDHGVFRCLEAPELAERVKAVTPSGIDHLEAFGMTQAGGKLLMRYGVYMPGDPNCCPCATIEASLRPMAAQLRVAAAFLRPEKNDEACAGKLKNRDPPPP